jgi:hypothetical protein
MGVSKEVKMRFLATVVLFCVLMRTRLLSIEDEKIRRHQYHLFCCATE